MLPTKATFTCKDLTESVCENFGLVFLFMKFALQVGGLSYFPSLLGLVLVPNSHLLSGVLMPRSS